METPIRQIRAAHTGTTVTVYQAYPPAIGDYAAQHGRFPAAWSRTRMTWIKPSFLWMMHRCGWARKEGQERVLALEIRRADFDWALRHGCLSHYDREVHADRAAWAAELRTAPVRIQWDPERDLELSALPHRSLQVGLSGLAARRYAEEWLVSVRDVTELAGTIHALVKSRDLTAARALLPAETPYPLGSAVALSLGAHRE